MGYSTVLIKNQQVMLSFWSLKGVSCSKLLSIARRSVVSQVGRQLPDKIMSLFQPAVE